MPLPPIDANIAAEQGATSPDSGIDWGSLAGDVWEWAQDIDIGGGGADPTPASGGSSLEYLQSIVPAAQFTVDESGAMQATGAAGAEAAWAAMMGGGAPQLPAVPPPPAPSSPMGPGLILAGLAGLVTLTAVGAGGVYLATRRRR